MKGIETGIRPLTEEWFAYKEKRISATDATAILGHSSYKSALDVWARLTGKIPSSRPKEGEEVPAHLERGRYLEPACAAWYGDKTRRKVWPSPGLIQHPEVDWLCVTPDYPVGNNEDNIGGLECKSPGMHMAKDWRDGVPKPFLIQLQTQLLTTGWAWGSVAAILGGLEWKDLEFSQEFADFLMERLERFWDLNVQRDIPPKAVAADTTLLNELHPDDNGVIVVMGNTLAMKAQEYVAIGDDISKLTKERKRLQAEIKQAMGDNTYADIGDGEYLSWKTHVKKFPPVHHDGIERKERTMRKTTKAPAAVHGGELATPKGWNADG